MKLFTVKKCAVFALIVILSSVTGGCLFKSNPAQKQVKASLKKMAKVKNLEADLSLSTQMRMSGETLPMETHYKITYFKKPFHMKVAYTTDMGEYGSQQMVLYAEANKKPKNTYTKFIGNEGVFTAGSAAETDFEQFDVKNSIHLFLAAGSDFTEVGTESINGVEASRIRGIIKASKVQKTLEKTGSMLSVEAALGAEPDALKEFYKAAGDLPVTVWVDTANGYPIKFEADMTNVMKKMMEAIAIKEDAASTEPKTSIPIEHMQLDKMILSIACTQLDAAAEFEIPMEARAAIPPEADAEPPEADAPATE